MRWKREMHALLEKIILNVYPNKSGTKPACQD
jgi:hypothetical protein